VVSQGADISFFKEN